MPIILSLLTFSSQDATISDTLAWFPTGTYWSRHHIDFENIRAEDLYKEYPEFFHFKLFRKPLGYLPASLAADCISMTFIEEHHYQLEKEKRYLTTNKKELLGVFRFPDANQAVGVAIEAGEISPTGESVLGREVFSFPNPKDRKRYLSAVGAQAVLLFAESIETLERMILAGTAQARQMLDSEDYLDLPEQIPEDAQSWIVGFSITRHNEYLRRLRRSGADEELIDQKSEQYAIGGRYYITAYSLAEQFEERLIFVVGEKDIEDRIKPGQKVAEYSPVDVSTPIKARYHRLREERFTESVKGNKVILTTAYDRELINADIAVRREYENAMKAAEEKKDK